MSHNMEDFIRMSRYAGMREDLVQAGGGNSSYKLSSNRMLIKASGYQLADITQTEGYAVVDPSVICSAFAGGNMDEMTEEAGKAILTRAHAEGQRPSIETFLHAVTRTYTLHTHPITVNVLACRKDGAETLQRLFPEALVVPYAAPGIELAKAYFKACLRHEGHLPDTVFLMNHGLVVSAETADEVIDKTEQITKKIEAYLDCDFSAYRNATSVWRLFPDQVVWRVTDCHVLRLYEQSRNVWPHTFCPDCVVFLGQRALLIERGAEEVSIQRFVQQYGKPVIVLYAGQIYLLCDSVRKALEAQSVLSFSAQVMQMNLNESCNLLSDSEQRFLLQREDEKYRRKLK